MASQLSASTPATLPQSLAARQQKGPRLTFSHLMIYTVLIIGAIGALVPFVYTLSVSLMNLSEATGGKLLPSTPLWSNYAEAWREANFALYIGNSVKITAITLSGEIIFCTLAAYAFARMEFPGKTFLFNLLLATLMLPEAVIWIPNYITVSWLGRLGPIPWINNWPALTIPFMAGAFSIFLLRQFFSKFPMSYGIPPRSMVPAICVICCKSWFPFPKRR
jgi:multiple sugar transport system permease protein